ncbi:sensor histidine kinase [Streptosporangium sp. NPDC000396]|uniref:sensor histidine kinase n=1 Tax=Streptosporangium sp. NPDC000396 TaxID=3366185 RepID=UPI003686E595
MSARLGRQGTEHSLMLAFAALRVGYGVQLLVTFAGGRFEWLDPLLGVAAVEAAVLVGWTMRHRALRPAWAFVADALLVAALALGAAHGAGLSWAYPYSYVVVVGAGLALRPAALLFSSIIPLILAVAVTTPVPGERQVIMASLPLMAAVSWYAARALRAQADAVDSARQAAVRAAAELARQDERAAHARLLSERVLHLFDQLGEERRVPDARLRAHVAERAAWLRRYLEEGEGRDTLAEAVRHAESLGLEVESLLPPGLRVPAAVAGAVREALVNVAKHAGISRARVTGLVQEGRLVVRVSDEGRGFSPERGHGFGLRESVTGRIEAAGGTVTVTSHPGRGTCVEITLALSPESGTDAVLPDPA